MTSGLLIGIDGGATHSTAVATWPDGRVAAVAHGDGLNFNNVGVETVRLRLEKIVAGICDQTGAPVDCVCAGSAALDLPADADTIRKFTGLLTEEQLDLQSDAYVALMGLTRGAPGMIVICGTGSMLMLADKNGAQHISGGWGYLMEDCGSGYNIARDGLIAAIDAYEDTGQQTALVARAVQHFKVGSLRSVIEKIYAPGFSPDMLAAFARCVIEESENGDTVSRGIITRNMEKLAKQAAMLFKKDPGASRTGLYGGIFAHSHLARSTFENALTAIMPGAEICSPEFKPELGAIIHLLKKRGLLTEDALENLKETYGRIRP